jgi:CubicO group peptidase (beta-lactamase class C family)
MTQSPRGQTRLNGQSAEAFGVAAPSRRHEQLGKFAIRSSRRRSIVITSCAWLCAIYASPAQATDTAPPEAIDLNSIGVSYAAEQKLPSLKTAFIDINPISKNDGISVGELGVDGGRRSPIVSFAQEIDRGDHGEIDSLLLWANGKLLFESYFRRGRINYPHFQMSITKSYTALAIGRAIQLGHLTMADLDRPVVSFLQGLHPEKFAAGASTITLSEAMTMQSGIRIPPKKMQFLKESAPAVQGVKQVQAFLENTASIAAAPREFKYQGTDTAVTMQVLEAVVPGSARAFIKCELLDKMGITNFGWQEDISGLPKAAAGSSMRSRDMLKWGLLVHNQGRHKGEQLIPPAFIDRATSRLCNTAGETYYGFFFWRHTATVDGKSVDCLTCRGAGGQFIFLFPGRELIAVVTAHNKGMGPLLKTLPERVLPAFAD